MLHARKIYSDRLSSYFAGFERCRTSNEAKPMDKLHRVFRCNRARSDQVLVIAPMLKL
jgi:hypothetical protein